MGVAVAVHKILQGRSMLLYLFLLCAPLACQAQATNTDSPVFPWYVWFIIALGLSAGIILIAASIFFIARNCHKLCPQGSPYHAHRHDDTLRLVRKSAREDDADSKLKGLKLHETNVDWEISRDQVKILQQLGIGEFGPILDVEVKLGVNIRSRALVKVFQKGTSQDLVCFREDIEALMLLNHPRVAKLFGIVSFHPYWGIMELTVNGDLKSFLFNASSMNPESQPLLTSPQLVAMTTDVAAGLAHLESMNYVHKDVAARNCIVTQQLGVKITDFKVGRHLFRDEYAVQSDGTLMPLRWMAPESLTANIFDISTDVWSFGILMWEVMSRGSFPYHNLSDGEVVAAVCQRSQRLLQPLDCPDSSYRMMLRCWAAEPTRRPRMEQLHGRLESSILTDTFQ